MQAYRIVGGVVLVLMALAWIVFATVEHKAMGANWMAVAILAGIGIANLRSAYSKSKLQS